MKTLPPASLRIDLDRGAPIEFSFDGRAVRGYAGETVAMALWAAGIRTLRKSPKEGAPRGVFCVMGACQECVVVIDGRRCASCMTAVAAGLTVRSVPEWGE
jgi:predicted molibdopterin-dependent oxidoreductase YjgC